MQPRRASLLFFCLLFVYRFQTAIYPPCSLSASRRLNENICYGITAVPPSFCTLFILPTLISLLFIYSRMAAEKKKRWVRRGLLLRFVWEKKKKTFMNQNKPPTWWHTFSHTRKTQKPDSCHTHNWRLRDWPRKENEVTHLNIKTFCGPVNHRSLWYKRGNLINLEAADRKLCGQSRENCCW